MWVAFLMVCSINPLFGQNKRSLNNHVRYNTRTTSKIHVFPDDKELRIRNKEVSYRGAPIKWSNDSLVFDHLTQIKHFHKSKLRSINQAPKPYFSLNKDHNSYLDNNVQMFASPSTQTLEAGRINLSSHYLLFYQGAVGITDKLQMGVGFTLIPDFDNQSGGSNINGQFFSLSTKYKIRDRKYLDVAVGTVSLRTPKTILGTNLGSSQMLHYAYIAASADYSIANFSASIGQPYLGSISSKQLFAFNPTSLRYVYTMSGSILLSEQIALISENWWINGIFNTPGQVNVPNKGVPDFPLIGGRYYTEMYGGGIGIGNFLIPGVSIWSALYIDGYYYF